MLESAGVRHAAEPEDRAPRRGRRVQSVDGVHGAGAGTGLKGGDGCTRNRLGLVRLGVHAIGRGSHRDTAPAADAGRWVDAHGRRVCSAAGARARQGAVHTRLLVSGRHTSARHGTDCTGGEYHHHGGCSRRSDGQPGLRPRFHIHLTTFPRGSAHPHAHCLDNCLSDVQAARPIPPDRTAVSGRGHARVSRLAGESGPKGASMIPPTLAFS